MGKSPIKWGQHSDMTIAVDWDTKPQIKPKKNFSHVMRKSDFRLCENKDVTKK